MAKTPEEKRAYFNEWQRKRYHSDPAYAAKERARAAERLRNKYRNDPEHRATVLAKVKLRAELKADEIRAYQRTYKQENREHLAEVGKNRKRLRYATDPEYREDYKARARAASKTPEGRAYHRQYRKDRNSKDPARKAMSNLRDRIHGVLVGTNKSASSRELLGCSPEELRAHIEKLWLPGMTWENYGYYSWHVDHKKPIASFDLTDPAQQRQCFHYTNLQPLWREDNQSKGDREAPRSERKPFPIKMPTDADADRDHRRLQRLPATQLWAIGEWYTRSEAPKKLPLFINIDRTGLRASDRFHWNIRMACSGNDKKSPMESWYDPRQRESIERSVLFGLNPQMALSMTKYVASQFRPSAAKAIYELFGATKIYDPCGGWGDRLAAALATDKVEKYLCRDVNPLLLGGYTGQIGRYDTTKKCFVEQVPAEFGPPEGEYDLVFTSPPYFKTEKYHGADQSHLLYPDFPSWLTEFLFKTFQHAWAVLSQGGHLVINVADRFPHAGPLRICAPLVNWARASLPDCVYHGCAGYRIGKRISNQPQPDGPRCEPLLIFSKGPSSIVADFLDPIG